MNKDNIIGLATPKTPAMPVVLLDVQHTGKQDLVAAIGEIPQLEIVSETTSISLVSHLLNRHLPQIVFIAVEEAQESVFEMMGQIREAHPRMKIIVVSASSDTDLILRCFRAGIDEFLPRPLNTEELLDVLWRIRGKLTSEAAGSTEDTGSGTVIALWGSRGGCGATTLACNIAQQLSKKHTVALVDLHLQQGDLGMFMDAKPTYTIHDIVENHDRLDDALVDSIMLKQTEKLHLLLQPMDHQMVEFLPSDIEILMGILRRRYELIILDMGHGTQCILDFAPYIQQVLLVVNQNIPSICLATRKYKMWQQWGFAKEQVKLVVNAYDKRNPVTLAQIGKSMETKDTLCVRHDEARVLSAMNQGVPLQSISTWGKAFKDIAALALALAKMAKANPKPNPPQPGSETLPQMKFMKQAMI